MIDKVNLKLYNHVMPRNQRYILPDVPHHAFQRGNNRQKIFHREEDQAYFLKHTKNYAKENQVRIGAYCIMTNHFHLMVFPKDKEGLIKFMKAGSQKYSQYFNKRYKRTGKIWENRYKMNIVDPESSWFVARYIERNPLRAGMVKKAEEYKHSSAARHLSGKEDNLITEDILKNDRENYVRFFHEKDADDITELDRLRLIIQQQKAIGSNGFLGMLKEKFKVDFNVKGRGRPIK